MLRGSANPCTTWPVAGQTKSPAEAAPGAAGAAGAGAGGDVGAAAGAGAVGGAIATGPGVAAAGGAADFSSSNSESEYGCLVAIGSVLSMFDDCGGGGAAIVPPGPGSGRDSTRLDGTGVVSITSGAESAAPGAGAGTGKVATGGTGAGAAAGRVV